MTAVRPSRETIGERTRTHGHSVGGEQSPTYRCWANMMTRCRNVRAPQSKKYARAGIKVCQRWHKFENFLTDMGPRPSLQHSLDRFPNRNGDYKPTNVRWATGRQQRLNRASTRRVIRSDGACYDSIVQAAEAVGGRRSGVRDVCLGRQTSHRGFFWSFIK